MSDKEKYMSEKEIEKEVRAISARLAQASKSTDKILQEAQEFEKRVDRVGEILSIYNQALLKENQKSKDR